MSDQEEHEEAGRSLRLMITLIVLAVVVAAVLVVIDYRLKAQIIAEAAKLREAGHGQPPRPAGGGHAPAPRQPVPAPVPRVSGVDAVANGAGPPEDDGAHEAAPIVKPGDESARPPRRGSFDY